MQFLAPLFFAALAGLAIPVLIHLTQREKKQIVRFPSLMFVRRIPYQSVRRRKIHNWLLLFVRMAALALIIAAFARPLIRTTSALPALGAGAREVVVLLDTSYSMGYGDRWERARAAAAAQIAGLGASDRGSLVLFSSGTEIVARSAERDALRSALETAKLGAGSTRYAPALKVAGSILADTKLPRREAVLISDFQKNGWRGAEGSRLPRGAQLTPVLIEDTSERPNVGVIGLSIERKREANNQERATLTAGLVNRGERPVEKVAVNLELKNIPLRSQTVSLAAGASGSVTFEPFIVSERNLRGVVRIAEDALAADNSFFFVLSPSQPLRITLLDRGTPERRRHLAEALTVGTAPGFELVSRPPEALTDDDLRRSAVIVLNDVSIASNVGRRLSRYVEEGGGLFVVAGQSAAWPSDVPLLPATLGLPINRTQGEPARVAVLEYGHPVFEPFRGPRSGNFASAKVFRYRSVTPAKDAQVLARFDAGSPAAVERRAGNGRVLLWASALDRDASDLPIRALFPVFVRYSMLHLASFREPESWANVGEVLDPLAAAPRGRAAAMVVLTPSGRRVPLEDEGADVLELSEQGFYEVRAATSGSEATIIASNVDPAEGDLAPMNPEEVTVAAVGDPGEGGIAGAEPTPLTPEAQENSQRLWQYLLFAGIVLLGVDTVLSNRLAKS